MYFLFGGAQTKYQRNNRQATATSDQRILYKFSVSDLILFYEFLLLGVYDYKYEETKRLMKTPTNSLSMDDPLLLEVIRRDFLRPPSSEPYSDGVREWAKGDMFGGQHGQARHVVAIKPLRTR